MADPTTSASKVVGVGAGGLTTFGYGTGALGPIGTTPNSELLWVAQKKTAGGSGCGSSAWLYAALQIRTLKPLAW